MLLKTFHFDMYMMVMLSTAKIYKFWLKNKIHNVCYVNGSDVLSLTALMYNPTSSLS